MELGLCPASPSPSGMEPLAGQRAVGVGAALHAFPKESPNRGAKRCLMPSSALLSSGLGLSTACLAPLGSSWCPWPCAAGRRVWRASGVKEMSSLYESYLLGLSVG